MNLQILPSPLADLDRGKRFYAAFDPALGRLFGDEWHLSGMARTRLPPGAIPAHGRLE